MKEELLGGLRQTLSIINSQDFRGPSHKERIERQHAKFTVELFKMGLGVEVMRLRYESNTQKKFVPRMVDKLPVSKSRVGFIFGSNHKRICVERDLLGRIFVRTEKGHVVADEFFRPEGGQDDPLFQLARRHNGLAGIEGVVTKVISRGEAEELLFTGETAFKPVAAKGELAAAR